MIRLSLREYRRHLDGVPLPTEGQRAAFVEFVSQAHSWYKHLPWFPPGAKIHFFLDPFAGCDLLRLSDGRIEVQARQTSGFHYNQLPTAQHRENFGYLGFASPLGTAVSLQMAGQTLLPGTKMVGVPLSDGSMRSLPIEIEIAGSASVTALLHDCAIGMAPNVFADANTTGISWPEESGGAPALARIVDRSIQLAGRILAKENVPGQRFLKVTRSPRIPVQPIDEKLVGERFNLSRADAVLFELFGPEIQRQKKEMKAAIDAMCAV